MNAPSSSGRYRFIAEINMIPFIDITLVLLIIFMVMSPIIVQQQIAMQLPEAGNAEPLSKESEEINIQIDAKQLVYVNGTQINTSALEDHLRSLKLSKRTAISISADKSIRFEAVVTVMDVVKGLGISKMSVAVIERK